LAVDFQAGRIAIPDGRLSYAGGSAQWRLDNANAAVLWRRSIRMMKMQRPPIRRQML